MNRRVLLAVVAVVLVFAAMWVRGRYYYPITNENATGDVVVAFGDSLTYGTGAERGEAWPAVVAQQCGCEIVNRGVPGETTAEAMRRLESEVLALDPRMVIVLLGGNDMLQRLSREQMFENLRRIIEEIQSDGAMVVLVGLNGFPLDRGYGSGYRDLAKEMGCIFVPNILGGIFSDPKLKSDQIHPNGAGYRIMAERIYDVIEPYL